MKRSLFALILLVGAFVSGCKKVTDSDKQEITSEALINEVIRELAEADSVSNFKDNLKDLKLSNQDVEDGITIFIPLDYIMDLGDYETILNIRYSESDLKNHIVKGLHKRSSLPSGKKLTAVSGKELE